MSTPLVREILQAQYPVWAFAHDALVVMFPGLATIEIQHAIKEIVAEHNGQVIVRDVVPEEATWCIFFYHGSLSTDPAMITRCIEAGKKIVVVANQRPPQDLIRKHFHLVPIEKFVVNLHGAADDTYDNEFEQDRAREFFDPHPDLARAFVSQPSLDVRDIFEAETEINRQRSEVPEVD